MNSRFPYLISFFFLFLLSFQSFSQVGIGTTTPDPSSMLDISSTTQGLLAPRMTTVQRLDIVNQVSPDPVAEGLLVFDTDLDAFYFYDSATTSWSKLSNNKNERDNYKLIKTEADLATELSDGGNTTYLLDPNTYYEINGTITLAHPIDLNNAYISGLDANEDKLVLASGTMFSGANGGSIRNLTLLASGTVFGLSGAATQSLLFQNCIVSGSASVGSISGFGVVFLNIIQLLANTTGITYNNIGNLLLSNIAWFGNNTGTFETYTGTFGLIEKVSGFSNVPSGATGLDVSSDPMVDVGVINSTSFSGAGTYVEGYTTGSYPGYNFTNDWDVNCPGVLVETDNNATGDINLEAAIGTGDVTSFVGTGTSSRTKILGDTDSNNLFRFTDSGENRIIYDGKQTRYFNISASLSFQGNFNDAIFIFYFAKNGTIVEQTRVYREVGANNDVGAVAIVGTIQLAPTDYIEVWAERFSGAGNLLTVSLNLTAR